MKNPYLKQYRFIIKTLAPVFIGSGREVGKKEYIYDRNKNRVLFLDMRKLYDGLNQFGNMPAFQDYMLKDHKDLYYFFSDNKIRPAIYNQWVAYSANVGEHKLINNTTKAIELFVKDAYGRPYVPGSSLKGMLRTILENSWYLNHDNAVDRMANKIEAARVPKRKDKYLSEENQKMAVESFHQENFPDKNGRFSQRQLEDLINDSMRGLIIGDSEPLETSNLCICQKIDINTAGREKPLNLLRECLKPQIQVEFEMTMDTKLFPLTAHEMILAMKDFYARYQDAFMKYFRGAPPTYGNSTTFFLGGGTGYVSKTAAYSVFQDEDAADNVGKILDNITPENHEHYYDYEDFGVSPHLMKCTRYNERLYQMGTCCLISFKPK